MSGLVEALLARLEKERDDHARQALSSPQGRDDFEYGRVCGLYAGLDHARQALLSAILEADDADDKL